MVDLPEKKVGIISCSGEGCVEGTISRVATRLVLERLKPEETVTICLPLFLAGGGEERAFAKYYPTITVDGCDKLCAKVGTERYSGKPAGAIVVTDMTKSPRCSRPPSPRKLNSESLALAEKVAERIAQEVDRVLEHWR
ncbi:MAG: putative zinc-binding protein [Candidatus Bathyarchaeia archaeon]